MKRNFLMEEITDMVCSFRRITTTCARQWLYLLGNEGVVYSEAQNRFAGLDAAGVAAYRAFDAGVHIEDLRFIHADRSSSASDDGLKAIYALSRGNFPAEDAPWDWPTVDKPRASNIAIHNIPVHLEYPAGPLEDLCRDYFRNCHATMQPARCHLFAQHAEDGWTIYVNGRELLSSLRDEQIGLGLLHAARSLLYAEAEYDVAFHAAMVADRDCGIMLCAPREAGKSTLAAYLIAQGFDLLTDEPALLKLDTSSVASLRLPVALKEGSWTVLQHEWQQLSRAPIHVRSDGMKIRLLQPLETGFSAHSRKLTHILFPHYYPASVAHAERLPPLHTLRLLNEGGMLLGKYFDRHRFEAFLRLVSLTPAYTIRYASLGEATHMIHDLSLPVESSRDISS
jgi:hypothetical protein